MRSPSPSDFIVDVPSIGVFTFAKRTRRDNYVIASEYFRLTGGTEPSDTGFGLAAHAEATIKTLLVDGPDKFKANLDLDTADPFDNAIEENVLTVFLALRQKEQQFRSGSNETIKIQSQGDEGNAGVLV